MRVSTNKYRFFLILLLAAVVGGGIWYCRHVLDKSADPEGGILVYNCQTDMEAA